MSTEATWSDETLHSFVLDEFGCDPNVPSAHVGVAVTDGLVTLLGTVRQDRDRLAAVDAARRVDGIRVIVDAIAVGDNDTDLAADHAIANRLVQVLDSAPPVPRGATLLVRNSVIMLVGIVGTAFDRQTLRRLARYPPGVRWVRDNLVIEPLTCGAHDPNPLDSSAVSPSPSEISASNTSRSLVRPGPGW